MARACRGFLTLLSVGKESTKKSLNSKPFQTLRSIGPAASLSKAPRQTMAEPSTAAKLIAEFVGTFLLIFTVGIRGVECGMGSQ